MYISALSHVCLLAFQGLAPGFLQVLGFGSGVPQGLGSGSSLEGLGSKVWGFRVEFGGFGFQGLGFPGFVWRVWAPRFRVSGFRFAGLVSKVSGLAPGFLQGLGFGSRGSSRGLGSKVWVSFGWFGLQGLWFAGLVWSVWTPMFRVSGFSLECLDAKV